MGFCAFKIKGFGDITNITANVTNMAMCVTFAYLAYPLNRAVDFF